MKEQLPKLEPYVRDQYPNYFGLFKQKNIMLSSIDAENPNLGQAVRSLIERGHVTEVKVTRQDGINDSIVFMRREKPNTSSLKDRKIIS